MNNPNEAILLTDDGHPIGEVVMADREESLPPAIPEVPPEESREAVMRSTAVELTGNVDADKAVAELYPGYADAEMRKKAMMLCVVDGYLFGEAAEKVGVPERTVSRWAYDFGWDRLLRQELAAKQSQSVLELAKVRAERRTVIVAEQMKQAKKLRDKAMKQLEDGEVSVKSAAEAWTAAAKVEHTLTGLSEAGTVANLDGENPVDFKEGKGKQPLVVVFQNGSLPPVRRAR